MVEVSKRFHSSIWFYIIETVTYCSFMSYLLLIYLFHKKVEGRSWENIVWQIIFFFCLFLEHLIIAECFAFNFQWLLKNINTKLVQVILWMDKVIYSAFTIHNIHTSPLYSCKPRKLSKSARYVSLICFSIGYWMLLCAVHWTWWLWCFSVLQSILDNSI